VGLGIAIARVARMRWGFPRSGSHNAASRASSWCRPSHALSRSACIIVPMARIFERGQAEGGMAMAIGKKGPAEGRVRVRILPKDPLVARRNDLFGPQHEQARQDRRPSVARAHHRIRLARRRWPCTARVSATCPARGCRCPGAGRWCSTATAICCTHFLIRIGK